MKYFLYSKAKDSFVIDASLNLSSDIKDAQVFESPAIAAELLIRIDSFNDFGIWDLDSILEYRGGRV